MVDRNFQNKFKKNELEGKKKYIYIYSPLTQCYSKKKNEIPNISLKKTCIYMPVCMCVYIYILYHKHKIHHSDAEPPVSEKSRHDKRNRASMNMR